MSMANGPIPFPINIGTPPNAVPPIGYGVCDPLGLDLPQRMQLSRYATGAFFGFGGAAGTALVFAAALTAVLFQDGPKESDVATGIQGVANGAGTGALPLTLAETNAFKGGGIAQQGDLFKVVAIAARLQQPGFFDAAKNWNVDGGCAFYGPRVLNAMYDAISLSMAFADEECVDELGLISSYPDNAGPAGADGGTTNGTPVAQQLVPLPYPFYAGGRNTTDQVGITATLQRGLIFQSDPASPSVLNQQMQVQLRIKLFGTHFCGSAAAK